MDTSVSALALAGPNARPWSRRRGRRPRGHAAAGGRGIRGAPHADAGLAISNGVLVDEHLRANEPGVFAAGDVANAVHPFYGEPIRVEHWANALNQAPAAARNMLGQSVPYDRLPYFFSDQYEVGMEYSGYARGCDRVVLRGDPAAREFIAFWM